MDICDALGPSSIGVLIMSSGSLIMTTLLKLLISVTNFSDLIERLSVVLFYFWIVDIVHA